MVSQEMQSEKPTGFSQRIPAWLSLLSAAFPSVVGFQIVCILLRGNLRDLFVSDVPFLPIVAVCLIGWLTLFAISHWGGRIGKCIWALCCGYAVFWVLRDIIFPLPLGELDGTTPLASPTLGYIFAEVSVFLLSFGLLLALARKKTATILAIFVVVLSVSNVYSVEKIYKKSRKALDRQQERMTADASFDVTSPELERRPDIYQILFDEYQTVEHEVLRESEGVAPYDDFVCFNKNLANYNITYLSLPSLLTSTRYDPALEINEWHDSYMSQGLFKVLKGFGYQVEAFMLNPSDSYSPYVDYARSTVEISSEHRSDAGSSLFGKLMKLRMLPSFVTSGVADVDPDVSPPPADFSYYCTMKFREMVSRIKDREQGGNYVFVHMILPHAPNVMDGHGNYVGRKKGTRMGQVRLANKLTGELTAELKRLGRYDDSMIIIHADTGSRVVDADISHQLPYSGGPLKGINSGVPSHEFSAASKIPQEVVEARSQALLLIKPPGHHGYQVDESPSQLMDIPPTIMGVLGVKQTSDLFPEGVDLFTRPPTEDRLRNTYVIGRKEPHEEIVNELQEWSVSRGQFKKQRVLGFRDVRGTFLSPTD